MGGKKKEVDGEEKRGSEQKGHSGRPSGKSHFLGQKGIGGLPRLLNPRSPGDGKPLSGWLAVPALFELLTSFRI